MGAGDGIVRHLPFGEIFQSGGRHAPDEFFGSAKPLLENSSGTEAAARDFIEFFRIKEAGTCGGKRWRRVNGNEVELFAGAFEKTATVVDLNVRERRGDDLISIVVVEADELGHARDQFSGGNGNSPGAEGAKSGAHA